MKDNFKWSRFGQLLWHDIKNIWPRFGLTMLCLLLIPVALFILTWIFTGRLGTTTISVRASWIALITLLVVIMAPSRLYKNSNESGSGLYFAMLPASKIEKYISMLLVTMVICPLIFLLSSLVIDTLLWLIGMIDGDETGAIWSLFSYSDQFIYYNTSMGIGSLILSIVISYLCTQSIFLFTSTIFKSHKVTKTILWLLLIGFVMSVIVMPIMMSLGINYSENIYMYLSESDVAKMVSNVYIINLVLEALFAIGLYIWTGFRLKNMKY